MISTVLHQWTRVSALCHQHCESPAADCVSVTPQRIQPSEPWTQVIETRRVSITPVTPITLLQLAAGKARACLSNKASSSKSCWKKPGAAKAMQNGTRQVFGCWSDYSKRPQICRRRWQKTRREERKAMPFLYRAHKHYTNCIKASQ